MKSLFRSLNLASLLLLVACTQNPPLSLHWEMGKNDVTPGVCEAYLTLTNTSNKVITNQGWTLYFDLMSLHPIYTEGDALQEIELQASWHSIAPTATFEDLLPGESHTYTMRYKGNAIREITRPEGFFIVYADANKPISIPITYAPFTRPEQMKRGIVTWEKTPYAEGEYVYGYVQNILDQPKTDNLFPLLPQPKEFVPSEGTCDASSVEVIVKNNANIPLEGYKISISQDNITIESSDEAGAFYARQTLKQWGNTLPCGVVTDYPDLHHRGLMLYVARNYYPVDSIFRILDVMAELKLNVLHFHLTDDEAWRLELPGLPQLTEIGGRRGYTTDESECLLPMYCGGWDPNACTTANGYISRAKYIELLRYAGQRHIRVVPEIDMPGHMRAAKKAMGNLLTDSAFDARVYKSAQNYTDNVINVTLPYAIEFIDKVVTEVVQMHIEAGCPLTQFNIGGDEVPKGALTREEHQTFIDQVLAILERYNLQPMGWEEITHFCKPESRAVCYSWLNSLTKPLEMAEAGYPVVLANANRLYFDFAYCNHHQEKGLNWGGYTDEYRSFDWEPLIHPNVVGMNAQLWGEVIRSFAQVEWQIYPKIYGLAERAWNNRSKLTLGDYNDLVYHTFLPALAASNRNFHIQQPGLKVVNNETGSVIEMNQVMNGGTLLYRFDEGEWMSYESPVSVPSNVAVVKAKVQYLGKESNSTWLWLENHHAVDSNAEEKNTGATF